MTLTFTILGTFSNADDAKAAAANARAQGHKARVIKAKDAPAHQPFAVVTSEADE